MNAALGRSGYARAWRWLAGSVASLLILAAIFLGALRLLVAYLPDHADRIVHWIEGQTRLKFEYGRLDARMRWYGPEVVLQDLRILDRDGKQALFATREGAVGLDLWNFLRTGQLVAGRVRFDEPGITLVRLVDGRIRILGQSERPADRPTFDLDRLPAGHVMIRNATVTYRDLKTGRGPWLLSNLSLDLQRDHDYVTVEGTASLPASLGGDARFNARLRGSLDEFAKLSARTEIRAPRIRVAGLAEFLPPSVGRPLGGEGSLTAVATVAAGTLQQARLDVDFKDVAIHLPARQLPPTVTVQISKPHREAGGSPLSMLVVDKSFVDEPPVGLPETVTYGRLAGDFRLRHQGNEWRFRAADVRADNAPAGRALPVAWLTATLQGDPAGAFSVKADAQNVRADQWWPLLLAFGPTRLDQWAGLAPTGELRSMNIEASRSAADAIPTFLISADVVDLGVTPVGSSPGFSGLTATLSGTDQRGRIALRAVNPGFTWPRFFIQPIVAKDLTADIDWQREGRVWTFASPAAAVEHAHGRAHGAFTLAFEGREVSPLLTLDATADIDDLSMVRSVLPIGRMKPNVIAWFDTALQRGRLKGGTVRYHGPVRKFPFREGEGDFVARAPVSDVTLNYFAGFAPLQHAEGVIDFHNAATRATLSRGEVDGLRVTGGSYTVEDYAQPEMKVVATGSGDLAKALATVKSSPLGARLGRQFMALQGSGPATYELQLDMSYGSLAGKRQDYLVRTRLGSVDVQLPALRAPIRQLQGDLEIRNTEIRAKSLRGTVLGGPFEVSVAPGASGNGATMAVELRGKGRAAGPELPAVIGLPDGIRFAGTADWALEGRLERHGGEREPWPMRFDVSSDLAGLSINAPQPFAKPAAEPRRTRVRLELPGSDAKPNDVTIESASARARLRFAQGKSGKWQLERGVARFDGQPVTAPVRPGLVVEGPWPHFDLSEWLALGGRAADGPRLMDWLGPVDVRLDRVILAGFEFRDTAASIRSEGNHWRVALNGPAIEGDVVIPEDLSPGHPIVLTMKRLYLQSPSTAAGQHGSSEQDPRNVPAFSVAVDDFVWQSRHFGRAQAVINRDPQGLRFESLATTAPDFTVRGSGDWLRTGNGSRTRIDLKFASSDLAAASRALGYRPIVESKDAQVSAQLHWNGGPAGDALGRMDGNIRLDLKTGQLRNVKPGAGRMLGLISITQLPRRLAMDFRDVTDEGLAFDTVSGDFEVRSGNAYTRNLLLKGAAVDVGVVGRTGLAAEDYDQTVVVSGNPSGPLSVAGALAAGPVIGAGVLLLTQVFKGQLQGLMRAYYHIGGPWSAPVVERVSAPPPESNGAEPVPQAAQGLQSQSGEVH